MKSPRRGLQPLVLLIFLSSSLVSAYRDATLPCQENFQCNSGLYCSNATSQCTVLGDLGAPCGGVHEACLSMRCGATGVCEAQLPVNSTCTMNHDCLGGYCATGTCVASKDLGGACAQGYECLSGYCGATTNSSGTCAPLLMENVACAQDSDCAGGRCKTTTNSSVCSSRQPNAGACTDNADCLSLRCVAATCTEPLAAGATCTQPNDCYGLSCDASTSTCAGGPVGNATAAGTASPNATATPMTQAPGSSGNSTVMPTDTATPPPSQNGTNMPPSNIFNQEEGLVEDDSGEVPTNESVIDMTVAPGNSTTTAPQRQCPAFRTSGELRVAVEEWVNVNGSEAALIEKYCDISLWNVSLVDDMTGLFQGYELFNENISIWNTGSVTDMSRIFFDASSYNGDLSNWDTSKVTSVASAFQGASSFAGDLSAWNTSQVTSMGDMFRAAPMFNADISFWETGRVRDMSTMFWEATSFNVDLSPWDVFRVRDFSSAFLNATAFSQQLCWQFRENANVISMFCGTNGASIKADCICEQDLYYEEECVRESLVPETTCSPPSLDKSSAVKGSLVFGAILLLLNTLAM